MAGSGLNVAAAYIANPRRIAPLDASAVLSRDAAQLLGGLAERNAQAQLRFAGDALQAYGTAHGNRLRYDLEKYRHDKMSAYEKAVTEETRRTNRRNFLQNMAGGAAGLSNRSSRKQTSGALLAAAGGGLSANPLGAMGDAGNGLSYHQSLLSSLGVNTNTSDAILKQTLNDVHAVSGVSPDLPAIQTPPLGTATAGTPVAARTVTPQIPTATAPTVAPPTSMSERLQAYWKAQDEAQASSGSSRSSRNPSAT